MLIVRTSDAIVLPPYRQTQSMSLEAYILAQRNLVRMHKETLQRVRQSELH